MNRSLKLLALVGALSSCGSESTTDAGSDFITGGGGGGSNVATGGGAGTTGGGSATTGGGSGVSATGGGTGSTSCRELTAWAETDVVGAGYDPEYETDGWYYDWVQAGYATVTGTAGNGDFLSFEYWADSATPSLPATGTIAGPYASCSHCAFIYENCDETTCGKYYMGTSGSATVSAFSADVDAGTFSVTLTDVTFQEWDTANDVAVTGGGCLHLSSQVLSGTW
ncbi:MAG: hypothetical protein ACO1OB_20185 [Archangium sp.]